MRNVDFCIILVPSQETKVFEQIHALMEQLKDKNSIEIWFLWDSNIWNNFNIACVDVH